MMNLLTQIYAYHVALDLLLTTLGVSSHEFRSEGRANGSILAEGTGCPWQELKQCVSRMSGMDSLMKMAH